jgi:hypothetical protein
VWAPSLAWAEARLEVGGAVTPGAEAMRVRVDLRNAGDVAIDGPVQVVGRLLGNRDEARLDEAIAPGGSAAIQLSFPPGVPRPGVHALTLLVSFSSRGVEQSRAAYLLLALGAAPDPAVRLFVGEASFDLRGSLEVGLESADGSPHTVALGVVTPRGLRAEEAGAPVAVPGAGRVQAKVDLLRSGAAHDTRHGIVVVAEAEDGPEARTTVATASVRILPDPALLPRIRMPLLGLALLLLAASLFVELRRLIPPRA